MSSRKPFNWVSVIRDSHSSRILTKFTKSNVVLEHVAVLGLQKGTIKTTETRKSGKSEAARAS
jgi:hypothetical protein